MPQDLCNIAMDNNCPIAMLLPSTTGMGVCSMSLLFFLVNTHDEFLGTYRSATNQERYRDLLLFSEIFSFYASFVWWGLWCGLWFMSLVIFKISCQPLGACFRDRSDHVTTDSL